MKPRLTLLILTALLPASQLAQAQEQAAETRFMMLNQHLCPNENMPQVREIAETLVTPTMEELTDEGTIIGYGILEHAWGDEWNWNFYMITRDHASFVEAWEEFRGKMDQRRPDWYEVWARLCTAHKDNMYTVQAMR